MALSTLHGLEPSFPTRLDVKVERIAEKVIYFVIPSEAKNLDGDPEILRRFTPQNDKGGACIETPGRINTGSKPLLLAYLCARPVDCSPFSVHKLCIAGGQKIVFRKLAKYGPGHYY